MKRKIVISIFFAGLFSALAGAQNTQLESVLTSMDKAAANFKTVETDFVWDHYTREAKNHELREGTLSLNRNGNNFDAAATIRKPATKRLQVPMVGTTAYQAKDEKKTFPVLGFGLRGHDLQKSYNVKYDGTEAISGVTAQKLVLTPKADKKDALFEVATLWIDPARGLSLQQKFESGTGEFLLANYRNFKLTDNPPEALESVLTSMDKAAASFKTVETDFVWDQFSKVVSDHDLQEGTMYFRRNGNNVEMAANVNKPDTKQILFANGVVQVYQPKIEQVTKYDAGKNRDAFESFLVLGFGGRGHDLQKSFDVKYGGPENVGGTQTQKLILTPKSDKVKGMFQTITLWIDPVRGVSVQQKFDSSDGDYRLATYKNIKLNEKLPDVFKLKTTGKTKVVTPQG